jgi:hypothetical protein
MNNDRLAQLCPECAQLVDTHTLVGQCDARPVPYDLTVCAHCLAALRFDANLLLQPLSDGDWNEMGGDERNAITRARRLVMSAKSKLAPRKIDRPPESGV